MTGDLALEQVSTRSAAVLDEVERAVVGKRPELEVVLLAILADGHVLIEDYPGLAKTLVARSFAQVLDLSFARIQFTPDLLPADVTGSSIYRQGDGAFEFRPGPVFANLLLADEINRAPPKTQSALLEAMAERQVTIEGETRLAHDFNNLLAGISGSLELIRMRMAQGRTPEIGRYVETALSSVGRAAALTHRLLAFSRRQTLDPKPIGVDGLVGEHGGSVPPHRRPIDSDRDQAGRRAMADPLRSEPA